MKFALALIAAFTVTAKEPCTEDYMKDDQNFGRVTECSSEAKCYNVDTKEYDNATCTDKNESCGEWNTAKTGEDPIEI